MTERRADELKRGDVLILKGDRYTVLKAKQDGKHVRLTVDGRRGSFTHDVKGRTLYDVDVASSTVATERPGRTRTPAGPLISASGAQSRWATSDESRAIVPPAETSGGRDWDAVKKSEREIVEQLGAKLVAVEVEGGKLIVPPVTDSTVLGHLATMHGVRFDGVTFTEAKVWAKANPADPTPIDQVFTMLELEKAYATHEKEHIDFAALAKPHWHREKAPR